METKTDTTDWSKKLPSQILFEAANALEEGDRWIRNTLFGWRGNQVCFCAHGAIQYCGRGAEIQQEFQKNQGLYGGWYSPGYGDGCASSLQPNVDSDFPLRQRRYQIDPHLKPYYHLFLAHAFAQTVGCSVPFNDSRAKDKAEVVAKLREAAAYALEHQHKYLSPSTP